MLFARDNAHLNRRENDLAIADYDVAISLDPGYVEGYRGRGDAHLNKEDYDQAIADYDASLRRDPYDDMALTSLESARIALLVPDHGA